MSREWRRLEGLEGPIFFAPTGTAPPEDVPDSEWTKLPSRVQAEDFKVKPHPFCPDYHARNCIAMILVPDEYGGHGDTCDKLGPDEIHRSGPCDLGVGCDESGACYADHNAAPARCGRLRTQE